MQEKQSPPLFASTPTCVTVEGEPVRAEIAADVRGRPGVVLALFLPPEPAIGIRQPILLAWTATDADGVVYEDFSSGELEPFLPRLRARVPDQIEEV